MAVGNAIGVAVSNEIGMVVGNVVSVAVGFAFVQLVWLLGIQLALQLVWLLVTPSHPKSTIHFILHGPKLC